MRNKEIPRNSFGMQLDKLLAEKQMSPNQAVCMLKASNQFTRLNRSTLYRWSTIEEEKIPPRALVALDIIRNVPKINAQTEIVRGWIQKLQSLDEDLQAMRKRTQEIIAQLTFHQG